MKDKKSATLFQRIINRYRQVPAQLRSRKTSERSKGQRLITFTLLIPIILYCAGYIIVWQFNKTRTENRNAAYSELYQSATAAPSAMPDPTATPLPAPTETPAVEITQEPTAEPTAEPTEASTDAPDMVSDAPETAEPVSAAAETAETTAAPAETATAAPETTAVSTDTATEAPAAMDVAVDEALNPYGTPDADTLVFAIETPPPIQETFNELLELNDETVGFLKVGEHISLPVVQRKHDNDYYLNHSFERESSNAGALFMDGANLLVPKDQNLIIYGHNMKNGTMFHPLIAYSELPNLQKMGLVQFDSIYENNSYVPFAVFSVTTEPGSDRYLDIRQFVFDEQSHELFVLKMQKYSFFDIPVDVNSNDNILLLVTCEYVYDNGRFVVALREVRPGEDEDLLKRQLMLSKHN